MLFTEADTSFFLAICAIVLFLNPYLISQRVCWGFYSFTITILRTESGWVREFLAGSRTRGRWNLLMLQPYLISLIFAYFTYFIKWRVDLSLYPTFLPSGQTVYVSHPNLRLCKFVLFLCQAFRNSVTGFRAILFRFLLLVISAKASKKVWVPTSANFVISAIVSKKMRVPTSANFVISAIASNKVRVPTSANFVISAIASKKVRVPTSANFVISAIASIKVRVPTAHLCQFLLRC